MDEKIQLTNILKGCLPWLIEQVIVNEKAERIDTYVGHEPGCRNHSHYRTAIYFHCGGLNLFPRPPALSTLCFKTASPQDVV